jgi:hypothetical protein
MIKIRRWVVGRRKKIVWSEPKLPPYVKFNPDGVHSTRDTLQPGDISMGAVVKEFLSTDEDEDEGEALA